MGIEAGKHLPVGAPPSAEARRFVPVVEVANEATWVNAAFPNLPFRLERGKASDLGLFLGSDAPYGAPSSDGELEVTRQHTRSALIGRVVFGDSEGNRYRDVDIKGGGATFWNDHYDPEGPHGDVENEYAQPKVQAPGPKPRYSNWASSRGILDRKYAERDRTLSEFLHRNGVRTHRTLAILKLKEISLHGKRVSITEAKLAKAVGLLEEPVIQVRAFGTRARIANLYGSGGAYRTDAMAMVASELGIPAAEFSKEQYYGWFAKTYGEQVARLHSLGYFHGFLSPHNVTLDCRLTDFDTVQKLPRAADKRNARIANDVGTALDTLGEFPHDLRQTLEKAFREAYQTHLSSALKEDEGVQRAIAHPKRFDWTTTI